jgi:hypothetical protein
MFVRKGMPFGMGGARATKFTYLLAGLFRVFLSLVFGFLVILAQAVPPLKIPEDFSS